MHFYMNLIRYAPIILYVMDDELPAGFKYVITSRNKKVVTAYHSTVIAHV